jgi:hypothetical protein
VAAYEAPNLYDGQVTSPDMIGAGIYAGPETGTFKDLDFKTLSDNYGANPSGTLDAFFAGFPQFFNDYLPLLRQYMQMAADRHVPFCIYEFGFGPNNYNTPASAHPYASAMLDAAMEDPRVGPAAMQPIADSLPDGSIACQYFDTGWGFGFRWGLDRYTGQSPPSARRAYFNSLLTGEAQPARHAARRWPRGLMRRRASGTPT